MFLNVNTNGTYQYLRILETCYDEAGRHRQRVVANLGRLDKIAPRLSKLGKDLAALGDERLVPADSIRALDAVPWGPIMLARNLWNQLGLGSIIGRQCRSHHRDFDVAEAAFVMLASRLTHPGSEHALARWLETYYVCDAEGRRWQAAWLPEEMVSKTQRVRVESAQLAHWYRTLDALLAGRDGIERELYTRVCDLFSQKVDMVFYDVTSTYMERRRPKGIWRHGNSKDGRPRNVQVVLGVVLANGWPIAHHVFPGDTADKSTLQTAINDVNDRFGLRRVMIVADGGMVSEQNLQFLSAVGREVRYLFAIPGRRSEQAASALAKLTDGGWLIVDEHNRVQQVRLDESGTRFFIVESEQRKTYEQDLRQRDMAAAAVQLQKVSKAVASGRLKQPPLIAARAARALATRHGSRYYAWQIAADGSFSFHQDPQKMKAELAREGRYFLKTDDPTISPQEAVAIYKQLSDVEWAYRDLKDIIQMRPIHHKTERRAKAHIFVATLALFLKRTLAHQLDEAGVNLSPTEAFAAAASIGASLLDIAGERRLLTASGSQHARMVVKALGITDTNPPAPNGVIEMDE